MEGQHDRQHFNITNITYFTTNTNIITISTNIIATTATNPHNNQATILTILTILAPLSGPLGCTGTFPTRHPNNHPLALGQAQQGHITSSCVSKVMSRPAKAYGIR